MWLCQSCCHLQPLRITCSLNLGRASTLTASIQVLSAVLSSSSLRHQVWCATSAWLLNSSLLTNLKASLIRDRTQTTLLWPGTGIASSKAMRRMIPFMISTRMSTRHMVGLMPNGWTTSLDSNLDLACFGSWVYLSTWCLHLSASATTSSKYGTASGFTTLLTTLERMFLEIETMT